MTIRDIAHIAGVSATTVSRVLSGNAPVNAETRQRVEQAMAQHGYKPKPAPQKQKKSGTIGVLLPTINQSFFRSVLVELDRQMAGKGAIPLILPLNPKNEAECLRYLSHAPLDGVLMLEEGTSSAVFELLEKRKIPIVMCGVMSLSNNVSAVHVDDLAASYDGASYLLRMGHRHIGFISESSRAISSGFQRIIGSKKALEDHGITVQDKQFYALGDTYRHGYKGTTQLLAKMPELSAIFAFSDESAVGVMDALQEKGLRVPQDISVLGFDDVDTGVGTPPLLTSVHQPIGDIVSNALRLLAEMRQTRTKKISSIILPHKIVERKTCCPPAAIPEL